MSTHRWGVGGLAVFMVLVAMFSLSTGYADASLGEFTLSSSFGSAESEGIAVDESTGDVYVYNFNHGNGGTISKFDAEGNPVAFSALGSSQITGVTAGGNDETEMAVDNSTGPAKGDIYLAGSPSGVRIFGSDGKPLGVLDEAPGVPWAEVACGVAVDHTGKVYLGVYAPYVNEYVPKSNPVTNGDYTTSITGADEVCNVAADPEGSVYADTWSLGSIFKFAAQADQSKQIVTESSGTLAVANTPGAELFVSTTDGIQQYDKSGNLLSSFGNEGSGDYMGVAVNAKNDRVYAMNHLSKKVEIWQGVTVPAIQTGQTTNSTPAGAATLNGSVAPEGVSVKTCSFQYGLSLSYGSTVPCAQGTPLEGTGTLAVSANISEAMPNTFYHYRLSTADEHGTINGGDKTFRILVLPTVEDQPPAASSIARAAAQLTGTIDPEQAETSYEFEYGTTEDYGDITSTERAGAGAGDVTVSQQLGELLPDTTYHYRLVAKNLAGTNFGADHTFTTGAATPPTAVTGGSNSVGQNTAVIGGSVDTNGLPTTYGFELGTSTDYGPATGLGSVGAGGSAASVALSLTGLLPGTSYHYRLTATNLDGTSYGTDQTFTTSVFASTFATPPAPLPFVAVPPVAFPQEAPGSSTTPKALTKAQKLAAALKACHKKAKAKRGGCEKQARKRYAPLKTKAKKNGKAKKNK